MMESPVELTMRRRLDGEPPFPAIAFAQIDPTSVCDLHCTFCVGRDWVQAHMTTEMFDSVVAQLPGLKYVQLQGEGEPMLARRFWRSLEALRVRGTDVGFTTNGRHLTESAVERLVALGVRTIAVSIDSLDPVLYRQLRGDDVTPAVQGLHRLAEARSAEMDVFVTSVLTRATFDTFAEVIDLSQQLGLSPPSCQGLQQNPSYVQHYRGLTIEADGLNALQQEWVKDYLGRRSSARLDAGLQSYYEAITAAAESEDRCPFVRSSIHVRFDGAIFPCCFMKEDNQALGNVRSVRLDNFSISSLRSQLLQEIQTGQTPVKCRQCHVLSG